MVAFRGWQRWIAIAAIVTLVTYSLILYLEPLEPSRGGASSSPWRIAGLRGSGKTKLPPYDGPKGDHPIDQLIRDARLQFKLLNGKRSLTLEQAASRYRERRGRHPPPGFDVWFEWARKKDAIIVEEFFDRIHHDLNPFYSFEPRTLRVQTHTQPQLIRVRNGKSWYETDNDKRPPWIQEWAHLIKDMERFLPDLDMVVNVMDETRLNVPWEKVGELIQAEQRSRGHFPHPDDTIDVYSGLADVEAAKEPYEHSWTEGQQAVFWDHYRVSCPPDASGRNVSALPSFGDRPGEAIEYPHQPTPEYTYKGYVRNFTASQDPCVQPHLRSIHATFIESISMKTSHEIMPMFAGCKMPHNNEILIPGAMYLTDWDFYSGGNSRGGPWSSKRNGLIWRGTASGGRNKEDNWWHFHRHRFTQMMNGTEVARVEAGDREAMQTLGGDGINPATLPPLSPYNVPAQADGRLGEWVSSFADVGFVELECFPREYGANGERVPNCPYTDPFFEVAAPVHMQKQYGYKFLPDVDGNSYSARWRGFLRSSSMPLKATIYAEWHDDRLVPWVHFVPFDSSFIDIYGVMDYFLTHDDEARAIAEDSQAWAGAVLRREDMILYVWRLLLEYARLVDDNRDRLAFVGDLR